MTYASWTGLARGGLQWRNRNSVSYTGKNLILGPVSNFVILLVLTCLLFVFHLSQVTKTNSYSYIINDHSTRVAQLQEEHQSLLYQSARLKSSGRITNSIIIDSLRPPESVKLID